MMETKLKPSRFFRYKGRIIYNTRLQGNNCSGSITGSTGYSGSSSGSSGSTSFGSSGRETRRSLRHRSSADPEARASCSSASASSQPQSGSGKQPFVLRYLRDLTIEIIVFTKREPAFTASTMHELENQFNISIS